MNISNITNTIDDYNNLTSNRTDIVNDDDDINITAMMLTIPSGILFLFLMSIMTYTLVKPLINKK